MNLTYLSIAEDESELKQHAFGMRSFPLGVIMNKAILAKLITRLLHKVPMHNTRDPLFIYFNNI